jgi:DUF4097 and DUF4098 domain-containing protein YvlB
MKPKTRHLAFAVCMVLAGSWNAAASVQGSFQRTLQVSGPVDLEVLTRSGDVAIHAGPAGNVSITGKIHVGDRWFEGNRQEQVSELEKNPPIRQDGNSVRIDYVNIRDIAIDYDITVPADTTVRTHSGSGDQSVEGLRSKVDLESGSGDMRLANLEGDVHLHTGSGNVDARSLAGAFHAEAGSGDIRLEHKGGDIQIRTGSGNIEAREVNGALRAETGSGDIRAEGRQTGAWEVRTGSGNVELRLPQDAAFNLEASTSSGRVIVDHPVTMTVHGDVQRAQRQISGSVHGGGNSLIVHTGSGDVHIE